MWMKRGAYQAANWSDDDRFQFENDFAILRFSHFDDSGTIIHK